MWLSGRKHLAANEAGRKASWVRIPPSPPSLCEAKALRRWAYTGSIRVWDSKTGVCTGRRGGVAKFFSRKIFVTESVLTVPTISASWEMRPLAHPRLNFYRMKKIFIFALGLLTALLIAGIKTSFFGENNNYIKNPFSSEQANYKDRETPQNTPAISPATTAPLQ